MMLADPFSPGLHLTNSRFQLSNTIVGDIFPEAISYFLGTAETMGSDEESDDDDDDDDAEEIDLEKPKVKKQKTA